MSTLEFRFRLFLRAYPRSYRELREEEMVATFLESADDGQTRPSLADVWEVTRHGLAWRLRSWDRHATVTWRYGVWLGLLAWLSYVGLVQLGWLASGGTARSWWYTDLLDWLSAIAPLAVAMLFLSGAPRTARLIALMAVVPIGGFYLGFGSQTLRFVFPLAVVAIAPAPTSSLRVRSIVLAVAATSGFALSIAIGLIPSEQVLLSARLAALAASLAVAFALGWRRTAPALGVAIGAAAIALIAAQLHRLNLQPVAWLVLLFLAATQLPLSRRADRTQQPSVPTSANG